MTVVQIFEKTCCNQFIDDLEFIQSIQKNSARYVKHFEESADALLPPPNVRRPDDDVFDILQVKSSYFVNVFPIRNID